MQSFKNRQTLEQFFEPLYMRTHSQAHLPITNSSMSSEQIPIAHISEEIQIKEDPPSEEPEEIKDNDEPKVQAKSSIVPVDNLVSALKSFGGSSSKAGNIGQIQEPEPFSGKDPTKLKAFLFQCHLYFQPDPSSRMGLEESLLHCPIFGMWRSLQSPTLSGQSLADDQQTTTELPPENYMNLHIIFQWLFGGCLTRQLVQWTFQWTVR